MSGSSTCRSCGRPIVWAVTVNEWNMPLDAEPVADGEFVRFSSTRDGTIVFKAFKYDPERDDMDARKRYRSHFVTCPNAAKHRKPR